MPSVISKYLPEEGFSVTKKLIGKKEYLSKALIASSLILYGCKVTYPILKKAYAPDDKPVSKTNIEPCSSDSDEEKANLERLVNNNNKSFTVNGNLVKCQFNEDHEQETKVLMQQPQFDRQFLLRLYKLVRLMIPRLCCHESGLLLLHTLALFSRTFLSIFVAAMEGHMVKYIVQKDVYNFSLMLLKWLAIALPATFINSLIRYLECKLALQFRSRLVGHAYKSYFKDDTYYRVSQIDGRIENADHLLTDDIAAFTSSVAHLYSHITKPLFDCALIAFALTRSSRKMGAGAIAGPALATVVIGLTGELLRFVSPKFGVMVAVEADRKAYLRHIHNRIITNAEEIAFYKGHKVELSHLQNAYKSLVRQKNRIFLQKLWYVVLEQFLMKYVWSGTGMIVVSLPILAGIKESKRSAGDSAEMGISERTQYFTTARNLLLSGGDAVERLMSSYKEIVELAGYTYRVSNMMDVFDEVSKGKYVRKSMVLSTKRKPILPLQFDLRGQLLALGEIKESEDGSIILKEVPIVTPNGDVIVPSLSLTIKPGSHLLITGPNGCGKSSLFRIISGLWPVYLGTLVKPAKCSMFYIPQRPYMTIGSLREQVIYPDMISDMVSKGLTDTELDLCLKKVHLSYLVSREGGWEAKADWKDILSGGEKQRMAIARMFYHKPAFALLDECTSAVSMDVEDQMYQEAKDSGITLLTVAHRQSVWRFHDQILNFDGAGGWALSDLSETNIRAVLKKINIKEVENEDSKSIENALPMICDNNEIEIKSSIAVN